MCESLLSRMNVFNWQNNPKWFRFFFFFFFFLLSNNRSKFTQHKLTFTISKIRDKPCVLGRESSNVPFKVVAGRQWHNKDPMLQLQIGALQWNCGWWAYRGCSRPVLDGNRDEGAQVDSGWNYIEMIRPVIGLQAGLPSGAWCYSSSTGRDWGGFLMGRMGGTDGGMRWRSTRWVEKEKRWICSDSDPSLTETLSYTNPEHTHRCKFKRHSRALPPLFSYVFSHCSSTVYATAGQINQGELEQNWSEADRGSGQI